jgi:hypothetical protein
MEGLTMNDNESQPSSQVYSGPLDDPFKNWPNSDLLIEDEDRSFFSRHYPAFAAIFDWPDLRSLFATYARSAAIARKRSRRAGVFAVATGFLSLCVAATVPLADELTRSSGISKLSTQAVLGSIAAILATISMLVGYTQVLKGEAKTRWLTNRFWTERIRQFHFQLIVNNLPAVLLAVKDRNKLQDWLEFRTRELDKFKHDYLRGVEDKIHHLDMDEAEDRP